MQEVKKFWLGHPKAAVIYMQPSCHVTRAYNDLSKPSGFQIIQQTHFTVFQEQE